VIVFEGLVKVCNLAGICVIVKAGQMTSVRSGDNSGPMVPVQVTLDMLVASTKDTDLGGPSGAVVAGPHTAAWWTIGLVAAVPAVVLPIVLNRGSGIPPRTQKGCTPNPATGLCP
jgi:hypothetical protein